jgi:hypothetical protein
MFIVAVTPLIGISAVANVQTEKKKQLAANAALKYWQACAALPELSEQEDEFLHSWFTASLGKMAEDLIGRGDYALQYLYRGAALEHCVWGLDIEKDGMMVQFHHCAKTRDLARLVLLRARYRFEQGDGAGGVADVLTELKLARHIGSGELIIGWLVGVWMEDTGPRTDIPMSVALLARYLPTLDAAELRTLKAGLKALPSSVPLADAIRSEIICLTSFRKHVAALAGRDDVSAGLGELLEEFDPSADADEILAAHGGTVEGLLKAVDAATVYTERTAPLAALPSYAEAYAAITKLVEEVEAAGPLTVMLVPRPLWIVHVDWRLKVRHAALRAAIDVLLDGPEAVKRTQDPCGDGPFSYEALPDGAFVLTSALREAENGKPGKKRVSLTVGQTPK